MGSSAGEGELALRLSTALWRFWHTRDYLSEGVRWLDRALAGSKQAAFPARVRALEGIGWLTQRQGDTQRAGATYEAMLKLSRRLGDKANIATALNSLGTLAVAEGDNEQARSLLEENLAVLRELENEGDAATPLKKFYVFNLLGALAINEEDDYSRGAELWEAGLALARETGEMNAVGSTLSNLGYAALLQGEYERTRTLSEEALTLARGLGAGRTGFIPETLVNLGLAAREQGYHERADACFKEALVASQRAGTKPSVINTLEGMAGLAGAVREDIRAARLWGLRRRHASSPASLCHLPSGRCTNATWPRRVPGWGRRHGTKGWSRDVLCRSKWPPSTFSQRRRINPKPRLGKISRPKTNRWVTLPTARER